MEIFCYRRGCLEQFSLLVSLFLSEDLRLVELLLLVLFLESGYWTQILMVWTISYLTEKGEVLFLVVLIDFQVRGLEGIYVIIVKPDSFFVDFLLH